MEKILTGEDVLLIKKTSLVRKYSSETEGFKDKTYRIYAIADKGFAVHEDDDFHQDLKNGNVQKVLLTVDEKGQLSLANYVTWQKANAQKRNQVEYDSITVESFNPNFVNNATINAIS